MKISKQLLLFFIFTIHWGEVFSQHNQPDIELHKRLRNECNDSINIQAKKIDSLKTALIKIDSEKRILDSLKKENESLKSAWLRYQDQMNKLILDSLETAQVKPGYYFRILPKMNELDEFNNEIEWINITKNHEVKIVITANHEYCMQNMHFAQKPKEIYKQIKRNQEKFDSLYLVCNQGQNTVPYIIKNDNLIVLSPLDKNEVINDVLTFQKNKITRRVRNANKIDSFTFEYIGK